MSKRKDLERAEAGEIYRSGKLIHELRLSPQVIWAMRRPDNNIKAKEEKLSEETTEAKMELPISMLDSKCVDCGVLGLFAQVAKDEGIDPQKAGIPFPMIGGDPKNPNIPPLQMQFMMTDPTRQQILGAPIVMIYGIILDICPKCHQVFAKQYNVARQTPNINLVPGRH